jgi:hypothetical protein
VTCLTLFGGTNAPLRSDASGTVSGAHIHLDAGAFPFPFGNCGRPGVTVELDR